MHDDPKEPVMYEDHYQRIDFLHAVLLDRGQGGQLTSTFTVINQVEASLKADGLLGPLESLRVHAARGALHRRMLRAALIAARGALDATQYPPAKYDTELAAARARRPPAADRRSRKTFSGFSL
jgi:hypothetical protein